MGKISQPTMRPDHMLMPSKKPTARIRPGEACVAMSKIPPDPSRVRPRMSLSSGGRQARCRTCLPQTV